MGQVTGAWPLLSLPPRPLIIHENTFWSLLRLSTQDRDAPPPLITLEHFPDKTNYVRKRMTVSRNTQQSGGATAPETSLWTLRKLK